MEIENDPLSQVETDAYDHSMMHIARGHYKKSRIESNDKEAEKSTKTYHFLKAKLAARAGSDIIDDNGECTMCGKHVDE